MVAALALIAAAPAAARTLLVGPGEALARPSEAARVAQPGDRIQIAAGTYYDCAVWSADSLVIEGAGSATRLTDATCQGKAVMVIDGRGITVANLTLTRARVPDGNGAGIRAEGGNLTLRHVRFEDNQDGLLAADSPGGVLRIEDCTFVANGVPGEPRPTAALVVGAWARLEVQDSRFEDGRGQSAIVSHAALTQVEASQLGAMRAGFGPAILATGGLVVEASTLVAGDGPNRRHAAVLALPAVAADAPLVLRRDVLQGDGTLLLNWSGRAAKLSGNVVGDDGTEASSAGVWGFRLRSALHEGYDAARAAAGKLHWRLRQWLHRG